MSTHAPREISYGSHCSGIDAPLVAMSRQLGLKVKYAFGSDINPICRALMSKSPHARPQCIYDDATQAPANLPSTDFFSCGFPCQSYSALGLQKGMADPRGNVVGAALRYIRESRPTLFLLENVKALMSNDGGKVFTHILESLADVRSEDGKSIYAIEWKVMSPHELGFPQSRGRVWIVGWRVSLGFDGPFPWPTPTALPTRQKLGKILQGNARVVKRDDPSAFRPMTAVATQNLEEIQHRLQKGGISYSRTQPLVVDPHVSSKWIRIPTPGVSICLTSRCCNFYILGHNRWLSVADARAIMGFEETDFDTTTLQAVGRTQQFLASGNSQHVGLVAEILKPLIAMLQGPEARVSREPTRSHPMVRTRGSTLRKLLPEVSGAS